MSPKISLTIGLAVGALAVAQPASAQMPDVVERAVAAKQSSISNQSIYRDRPATLAVSPQVAQLLAKGQQYRESAPIVSPDAVDRARAAGLEHMSQPITPPDAVDRAVSARADYGGNRVFDDRFNTSSNAPAPVSVTNTGDEIQWPEVGIGFGIGTLFVLGLILAVRLGRARTLAHS